MICARCGHDNEAGANFCSSCGAPLASTEDETTATLAIEDRQELDDVPRILSLSPEDRLQEVANLNRFAMAAHPRA